MTTLDAYATFLTARWDEAEKVARDAGGGQWVVHVEETADGENIYYAVSRRGAGDFFADVSDSERSAVDHIALHDPQATLDDLAAKRAILKESVDYSPELEHGDNGEWAVEMVVTHLAAPFCDHPDHPANQEA